MPESGRMDIEGHGKVIRLLLLQNPEHDVQEAIDGIGVQPPGIGQGRQAVVGPVQYAVSVYQYQLFVSHYDSTAFDSLSLKQNPHENPHEQTGDHDLHGHPQIEKCRVGVYLSPCLLQPLIQF